MTLPGLSSLLRRRVLIVVVTNLLLALACTPVERPKGPAFDYNAAKDMFKRNRFDRVLEFTDGLVAASPPNSFTDRARVLRVVVLTGQIKAYKSLADAYTKGIDNIKDLHHKGAYGDQRHDNLQLGAKRALNLGEVGQLYLHSGGLPKELTLEAPYPTAEGPTEVKDLGRIAEGGWVEPEQQDAAVAEAINKGIDDALAELVAGDPSKARSLLTAGPVKLSSVDFGLYLAKSLLEAASLFDRKHIHDPDKARTLANQADEFAKAALALLKENPNKDKEQEIKKLQGQIKTALKAE